MLEYQYIKVDKGIGKIDNMFGDIHFSIEKPIQTVEQVKYKLIKNSETLLLSRNLFIEKSFIELPEKENVLNFIRDENPENNILILTGRAGNGKTALLSEIQQILKDEGSTYLSIKSDSFTISSKESLNQNFEVEDLYSSILNLSKIDKVTVLIDQVDALSLTLSSNREPINIILEFIQSLKRLNNINIVISIREYDLKNDPLLKKIDDTNVITMGLIPEDIVKYKLKKIIKKHGELSSSLLYLLQMPLHLSLFLELNFEDASHTTIKTLQDLYKIFWKQKILDKTIDEKLQSSTLDLIEKIIIEMDNDNKVEAPSLYFEDDYPDAIDFLLSNHILLEKDNKFTFFHQTFYDYIFAKTFVKSRRSLYEYILSSDQSITIRERIKQIIEFLRATDFENYLKQLVEILYSEHIRFHIKLLLISYLGNIDHPQNDEFEFLQKLFHEESKYLQYFLESWISVGWLIHFYNAGYFTQEYLETYHLKYRPEIFINRNTELVLEILEQYPEIDSRNEAITLALSRLELWNPRAFLLFENNYIAIKEDTKISHWYYDVLNNLISYDIDFVIEKTFENIFEEIDTTDDFERNELLNHNIYEIFEKLLNKEPIKVIKHSLIAIEKIVIKTKNPYKIKKAHLIDDSAFGETSMWQFDFGLYNIWRFYKKILDNLLLLAEKDNMSFITLLKPYQNSAYVNLLAFSIFGYSVNPRQYKSLIFQLLTNEKLLEEIEDSFDVGYKLKKLLKVSFLLFNDEEKNEIILTIAKVNPKWEWKYFYKKCSGNLRGYKQYIYFLQLPIDDISRFGYLKEFQELQRKFHEYKEQIPNKSNAGFVGTPVSKEVYERMSLTAWKQSMTVFDKKKTRESSHDFMRGDISQHSRQFQEEVKSSPDRFYSFLFAIRDDVSPDYLTSALNGLIEANYDYKKIIELIKCYINIDDRQLQQSIIRATEKFMRNNIFDLVFIDIFEQYKHIEYEGFKRDKKEQSIRDHILSAINSMRGVLAESLPFTFKYVQHDLKNKERVSNLVKEIITDKNRYVIFGLLRAIGEISKEDNALYLEYINMLTKQDESGQITLYLLEHLNYLVRNSFITLDEFYEHLSTAINYISLLKDDNDSDANDYGEYLGLLLFFNYVKVSTPKFHDLLKAGIKANENILKGVVSQAFNKEITSNDETRVNLAKEYVLEYKDNKSVSWSYQYELNNLEGLNLIETDFNFVKKLAKSLNIQKDSSHFWEYLRYEYYQDFKQSDKILEIINIFLNNEDTADRDSYGYRDSELITFILELYSRAKKQASKTKCLDLLDQFLMSDRYRNSTQKLLEQ